MKYVLLTLLIIPLLGVAQLTYVPDDNFEQKLIVLGYDDVLDDYVITSHIDTVTELDLSFSLGGIKDLTGIKDFIALKSMNCKGNDLTSLDVCGCIACEVGLIYHVAVGIITIEVVAVVFKLVCIVLI